MSEEKSKGLVAQILPKTLAGLTAWLLIFAAGMAASGVGFFAYYRYQLDAMRRDVTGFKEEFDKEFEQKQKAFKDLVDESRAEIKKQAGGSAGLTEQLNTLLEKVGPSIAQIQGNAADDSPTSGSGFVVTSDPNETWILTSFHLVEGSAAKKSPVKVKIGESQRDSNVWSWDEGRDLALIILKVGRSSALEWAEGDPTLGERVWAVGAGSGKFGATASQGVLMDISAEGLLTDADIPTHLSGGVLLDRENKVLGLLSLHYAPPGFAPSNGWVVPVRLACKRVLRCPG